mgnify:CR=1 FL=1
MAVVWRSVLVLVLAESALAVEQGVAPNGMPEPPPLSKTLLQVFDKDHSGGVTLQEVTSHAPAPDLQSWGSPSRAALMQRVPSLIHRLCRLSLRWMA